MPVHLSEIDAGTMVIKVDRPQVRNALDWEAMDEFVGCIDHANQKRRLSALILTGANDTFISGGDLKALATYTSEEDGRRLSTIMSSALTRLEGLSCLTIAAVNGPARGGGAEIALACDLRVLSANADLGFVQISMGLSPGWGGGQRLLRHVGYSHALEWLASGRILTAQEAFNYGLANRVTPEGEAINTATEIAQKIASQPPEVVKAIKYILRAGTLLPKETAEAVEMEIFSQLWAQDEHLQAVERFLKRK
jgi:enoyl-CoA hydratase/carnithine racemase